MKSGKRANPEGDWTLEQIHSQYQIIARFPGSDYTKAEFWKQALAGNDVPSEIKGMSVAEVQKLWEFVQEKTKNNIMLFKSLFRDYERTMTHNNTFHEKIKGTLNNLFFGPVKPSISTSSEGKREPKGQAITAVPSVGMTTGGRKTQDDGEKKTGYEFKVAPKRRFPNIDLAQLCSKESNVGISARLDNKDRKLLAAATSSAKEPLADLLIYYRYVVTSTIPEELLNVVLGQAPSSEEQPAKPLEEHVDPEAQGAQPSDQALEKITDTLKELQAKYAKTANEITELYTKVSGDINALILLLEGQPVPVWTELEDLALQALPNSPEYKGLIKSKGIEEVTRRRAFLGV